MTCLTLIQSVCARVGLPQPNAAVTSSDQKIQQLVAFANEEGQELAARYPWSKLTVPFQFTTIAAEQQFVVSQQNLNINFIINNTIWNRTLRRPVFGPLSPQQWEQQKAMFVQGPWNQFRIIGDGLFFLPAPAAGQTCVFEYQSLNWNGGNPSERGGSLAPQYFAETWIQDADVGILDEKIMALGVIWRWKAAKGLPYAEDFAKYEKRVNDEISRDSSKAVLNMGDKYDTILPGVWVPAGSW